MAVYIRAVTFMYVCVCYSFHVCIYVVVKKLLVLSRGSVIHQYMRIPEHVCVENSKYMCMDYEKKKKRNYVHRMYSTASSTVAHSTLTVVWLSG